MAVCSLCLFTSPEVNLPLDDLGFTNNVLKSLNGKKINHQSLGDQGPVPGPIVRQLQQNEIWNLALKVLVTTHVTPGGPPGVAVSLGPRVLASASSSSRPCSCQTTGHRGPRGPRKVPCGLTPKPWPPHNPPLWGSALGAGHRHLGRRVVTELSPATRFTKARPWPPSCPLPPQTRPPTWLNSGVPCNAAKPQTLLSPPSCCRLSIWSESGLQSTEVTEGSSFGSEPLRHHRDALLLQQKQPSS